MRRCRFTVKFATKTSHWSEADEWFPAICTNPRYRHSSIGPCTVAWHDIPVQETVRVTKMSLLWIGGRPHVHVPLSRYDKFYWVAAILTGHSHTGQHTSKKKWLEFALPLIWENLICEEMTHNTALLFPTCPLIPHHFHVKFSSFLIWLKLDTELTLIGLNNVYWAIVRIVYWWWYEITPIVDNWRVWTCGEIVSDIQINKFHSKSVI